MRRCCPRRSNQLSRGYVRREDSRGGVHGVPALPLGSLQRNRQLGVLHRVRRGIRRGLARHDRLQYMRRGYVRGSRGDVGVREVPHEDVSARGWRRRVFACAPDFFFSAKDGATACEACPANHLSGPTAWAFETPRMRSDGRLSDLVGGAVNRSGCIENVTTWMFIPQTRLWCSRGAHHAGRVHRRRDFHRHLRVLIPRRRHALEESAATSEVRGR